MEKELRGSEQKFGTIIEGSADAIFLTDHEGNYTYANKGASDLLGYSREEITEMNIVDISPVGKLEEYQKTFQKIVEEEKIHTEITIIDKEGKTIPVDLNAVLLPNGMVYGSIRDISDRKEAEEKLMEQEKKYRSIFEQFQDLYYRTDAEGFIQELSPSVKDLSGYDRDELIGEYVGKVYPNPEEREGLLNELSENGEVRGYEMKLEKKSGEKAVVSVNSHLIMDEDGEVEGVEGTIRDITERKEAQERQNFLHSLLRHDMANKAQAVQGYLQLLEEDETLSEDSKKMVNGTLKANKESINLIQKVRLLLSAQKEEKKSVRIVPIIKGAVESNKPIAEKVGMDISVQCPSLDCEVEGGSLLDEVFYNIIENSIKHSGGSKIQISGEITEEEVVCTIEDDGVGIPDDKKEIIFEKGYTTDEERGTGLGMFIVNMLLESYGGYIEVKDSKLGGARFDVKLKRSD
ncbi:MAG: PAS domain S-box protein, partial [Candidatus Saliniplasma sp.]